MRFPAPVINCQEHKSVLSKPFTHNSFHHTIEAAIMRCNYPGCNRINLNSTAMYLYNNKRY
jgi:hypothetical protein